MTQKEHSDSKKTVVFIIIGLLAICFIGVVLIEGWKGAIKTIRQLSIMTDQ